LSRLWQAGASGFGADLADCQRQFEEAWIRIRAGLTEADVARAHKTAKTSTEALQRYQQRRPV